MRQVFALMIAGVLLAGCTSDPDAPINRTFPIRQMDRFFGAPSAPAQPLYAHEPGYAPAYPTY